MKKMSTLLAVIALFLAIFGSCATSQSPIVEYYKTPRPMALPFSDAVRVGDLLFVSGELGVDYETMKVVEGGIQAQTRQALENIKTTLEKYGTSLENVVKVTVMIQNMSEWPSMNEVYVTFFAGDRLPARSAIGANGLALGALVEIEVIAVIP
jgi:2-iminobutanoate/2-iminopropanoate deaminase